MAWRRAVLVSLPAGLLGASLGLGKVIRDCSLTCNVGFELAPLAILAIAALALPLNSLRVRLEARWTYAGWHAGSALAAAASFVLFRLLTLYLLRGQEAAAEAGLDPTAWSTALRWTYLSFYVWVGAVTALLGANAFGHVFRLYEGEQRDTGLVSVTIAIAVGGLAGSGLAGALSLAMLRLFSWRFETVRDNLLIAMAAVLLLQVPAILAISRQAGVEARRREPAREARHGLRRALRWLLSEPALARMAALMMVGGVADTLLKYLFYWLVSEQTTPAPTTGRTLYFATFYLWVNGASLMVLAFGSARVIRRLGLAFALVSLPVAVTLGAASLAFNTVLAVMYLLRIAESALHSTLYEPGIDRLYLQLEGDRAERARPLINGLVARVGEGLGAVLVLALTFGFGLGLRAMIGVLLLVLVAWVGAAAFVRMGWPSEPAHAPAHG